MDACPLCFLSRSCAVGSASAIFLATRRTKPLSKSEKLLVTGKRPTPVGQLHVPTSRAGRLPFSPRKTVITPSVTSLQACIPAFAGLFSKRILVRFEKGVFRIRPSSSLLGFPAFGPGFYTIPQHADSHP